MLIYTTSILQFFPDINVSQGTDGTFIVALERSISTLLGVEMPIGSIADVTVTASTTTTVRALLMGISLSYVVTVSSNKTTEYFISELQESTSSGTFAIMLSSNSGLPINSAPLLSVFDLSPEISSIRIPDRSGK